MKCYKCGKVCQTKYCPDCGTRLLSESGVILLHLRQWSKGWGKQTDTDGEVYGNRARFTPSLIRKDCFGIASRLQAIKHQDICLREDWMTQADADAVIETTKELYRQVMSRLGESA